jgi:hypothetical protein
MALRALQGPTGGGTPVGGTGTTNTIPRWTGPTTLGDSIITQTGTSRITVGSGSYAGASLDGVRLVNGVNSYFAASDGTRTVFMGADGNAVVGTLTAHDLKIRAGNADAMIVQQGTLNVGIGTASPTAGRSLTTAADIDVYGVRVGRGAGAQASNTAVGASALANNTTGSVAVAVGAEALNANSTGVGNTAIGYRALRAVVSANSNTAVGYLAGLDQTGGSNVAIGQEALRGAAGSSGTNNVAVGLQAGLAVTTGANNVFVGRQAGDSVTTGASNIVIGSGADTAAATTSNSLVVGDATNYVATDGGATTYYAAAGASLGYIQVRLNGADVKIQVFAP